MLIASYDVAIAVGFVILLVNVTIIGNIHRVQSRATVVSVTSLVLVLSLVLVVSVFIFNYFFWYCPDYSKTLNPKRCFVGCIC